MDIPDPVCECEIAEMKALYDFGPERACLDRMIWLEVEHAKLTDEVEYYQSGIAEKVTAAGIEAMREALTEFAKMARTRDQLELVHELRIKGVLK